MKNNYSFTIILHHHTTWPKLLLLLLVFYPNNNKQQTRTQKGKKKKKKKERKQKTNLNPIYNYIQLFKFNVRLLRPTPTRTTPSAVLFVSVLLYTDAVAMLYQGYFTMLWWEKDGREERKKKRHYFLNLFTKCGEYETILYFI